MTPHKHTRELALLCQLATGGPIDRIERTLFWLRTHVNEPEHLEKFMQSASRKRRTPEKKRVKEV